MKNIMRFLFIGALIFAITPGYSEICTDFDDEFNVIEYECGTSLKEAIKAQKQAEAAKQAAEEKAKKDAERAEQLKAEQAAAAEKARRAAERAEQERKEAAEKARKEAERAKQKRIEEAERAEKKRLEAERKAKEEAERAEKKRIEAEQKAKEEAERAEKKRIEAEKKAKKDAERAAKKKKEQAERKRAREKRKAENKAKKEKFWSRTWHPFVAVGYKLSSTDYDYDDISGYGGGSTKVDFNSFDLQIGINYRPTKSNWEYGLRAGYFIKTYGNLINEPNISGFKSDLSLNFKQTYIDVTIGYEILNYFNIYGGAGFEDNEIDGELTEIVPPYFTNYATQGKITNSKDLVLFVGAEYWFWNNFGMYLEYKLGFVESLGAGLKLRF